jgi:hypothetical protein
MKTENSAEQNDPCRRPIITTVWTSRGLWRLSSNLANDLLRVDLQGYEAVCNVNLPPRYAILGLDFAAIIQPDDHG